MMDQKAPGAAPPVTLSGVTLSPVTLSAPLRSWSWSSRRLPDLWTSRVLTCGW